MTRVAASALSLKQLRYFVVIADTGGLSRAAEALNVAQSALSHHVADMETSLQVKLLERKARGIELTPAGRRLLQHANAILSALSKAEADVRTFTEVASGPVTVGLSHTAVDRVSLDLMRRVRATCPAVHMTLVEGLSPTLIERVISGDIDIALAYNPPTDSRLDTLPLLQEHLYLVGRPDLIGASPRPVAFVDIPQDSVLGLSPVPASRAIIQPQILRNQIATNPNLELASLSALKKALQAGLGCAILARSTVLDEIATKRVHARRIVNPDLQRSLAVVTLVDRPRTRAFDAVRDVAAAVVSEALGSGRWPAQQRGMPLIANKQQRLSKLQK